MQSEPTLSESCRVRVFLHGPLLVQVRLASGEWKPVTWEKRARAVFRRLLVSPGRLASQLELADDIWSENEEAPESTSVYVAISLIRSALGKELGKEAILTYETGYQVAGQDLIWVDLDAADLLIDQAENQGYTLLQVLPLLEEAYRYLSRGPFLEGEIGQWRYGFQKKSEDLLKQCCLWLAENYEVNGRYWQAEKHYRMLLQTMPPDEEALQAQIALRIEKLDTLKTSFSATPGAVTVVHHNALWPEDLLQVYREGIIALYDLYLGGKPAHVEALLPLYAQQTVSLVTPGSVLTQPAARLASLTQQLVCELGMDRQDYGIALRAGQHALRYAEVADDRDLQVSALIKLGSLGYHRRDGVLARSSYERAIALAAKDPARVTPLLQARCYSGVAQVYAMCSMEQEAYRAMGKAYESYPMQPEQDPAYPYLRASRFALYVYGDCQTRLFLGQPNEAAAALEALEREGNRDAAEEPITCLDLLSNYAEIRRQQEELEATCAVLTEAAQLSKQLGSRLYFNKLAVTFHELRKKRPHESLVSSLDEVFQPW